MDGAHLGELLAQPFVPFPELAGPRRPDHLGHTVGRSDPPGLRALVVPRSDAQLIQLVQVPAASS